MNTVNRIVIATLILVSKAGESLSGYLSTNNTSDVGEGVVSSAIAVLIFAFLGVILWVAFKATMGTATNSINAQVAKLGQ